MSAKVVYVLNRRYAEFSYKAEYDARSDIESLKQTIIRRLSDRDSFVSWKKTHMMLRQLKKGRKQLKKGRKEFHQLEERLDYERCCIRKSAARAHAWQEHLARLAIARGAC
jgi:hypothetical protein